MHHGPRTLQQTEPIHAHPLHISSLPTVASTPSIASTPQQVADACTITPALRAWVECLVDTRVDQVSRQMVDTEFTHLVEHTRRELSIVHQAEDARQRLEAQVRGLADAQARILAVVEGLSGDTERQYSSSGRARAEALGTVERVMQTVDELQRTVEQDSDSTNSRLREHSLALDELRRSAAEETAKQRAATAELQRHQAEGFARQRHCSDELATACSSIAATRQEVGDLTQLVQRLERRLASWKEELAAEVIDEVTSYSGTSHADRQKIEALQRDANIAAAARIDIEARLESLRVEMAASAGSKIELDGRLRETQQVLLKRLEDVLDNRLQSVRTELSLATSSRCDQLDTRVKDGHQALTRRLDALQAAATQDVEAARHELAALAQITQRLEHKQVALRTEVTQELRSAFAAVSSRETSARDEHQAATESFRREVSHQLSEMENRFERLQVELATVGATRESYEFRVRESQEELRNRLDSWQRELATLNQRMSSEAEGLRSGLQDELASLQRQLGAELRAEARALLKQEQHSIAALDEQLWLTDQRLGQRIDELVQAQASNRAAVMAAASEAAAYSSAPHTPLNGARRPNQHAAVASNKGGRLLAGLATAKEAFGAYQRHDEEEDDPWRRPAVFTEPITTTSTSGAFTLSNEGGRRGPTRSRTLATAHEAAEALEELVS